MKVAISSTGQTMDSDVDPRFGRAAGFVVVNTESGEADYLDNTAHRDRSQGAGIAAAKGVVDAGAEALVTGQMGPKAAQVLSRASIPVYQCVRGTVREAVSALQANTLPSFDEDAIQEGPGKRGGRGMGGGGGRGRGGGGGGAGR
jgi:predicted Fe-Mo cluster-binding NifX family protein